MIMEKNCLVSVLKGSVQNENLPVFNKLILHITPVEDGNPRSGNRDLTFTGATGVVKNIASGIGCIYPPSKNIDFTVDSGIREYTYISTFPAYVGNGDFTLEIQNKYEITKVENNTLPISLSEFEWCTKLTFINSTENTSSNSNIEVLDKLILLTELNLRRNNATGEITTLASSQVANGRTSGTLAITSGGYITLNGIVIPSNTVKTVKFGTSMVNPTTEETAQGYQVV